MAPLDLQGETLGERHQNYNKLLKTALDNREPLADFTSDDNDVEKLLKIDLACNNRNVDYIINVFKFGDMLCLSRALAQSTWLVTEPQYAHLINPDYLHAQLLQHMSTKAFIKLNKHIRHHIQDEARAEQFYLHEKKLTDAFKWLPSCSVAFIEANIEKHVHDCKLRTFKRLCEKSPNIFEIFIKKVNYYDKTRYAQAVMFLLKADVEKYLDLLEKESHSNSYNLPKFNDKATNIIMKKCPTRIMDKFDRYVSFIDIPTFSKYVKRDEIKTFLYTQANKDKDNNFEYYNLRRFFNYDSLKYFIKRLPKDEQFDFVKKVFIDKENVEAIEENLKVGTEPYNMKKLYIAVQTPSYVWYRFASFERAFEDITRIISKDLDNKNKGPMLKTLITCADHNLEHIQTLLQYYLDKHGKEEYRSTLSFTTDLLQQAKIHLYDEKTWNLVNELFKILKINDKTSSSRNTKIIVDSIIVYNLLHDLSVPADIQEQFSFDTLKSYESKLNEEQKEKIFRYLYEYLLNKFKPITKEENSLTESIKILVNVLRLLRVWKKQLTDFPFVIDKIKEFVKTKRENAWKVSLLPIYNFNKSWRKHMFEESVTMSPCEEVCLNALKHDPQLLQRNQQDVDTLRADDAVSLRRLLAKLRIYWPHSLAQHWTEAYFLNLNKTEGHKATVRGICSALPQKPLLEFIEKYKPAQAKIDWNGIDDRVLSIQRFIAKNMHIARPQPSPDTILLYAKGDYLQYALPSLLAIFYNLNIVQSQEHIPKLLDAPVSVQKHGIRLAYRKLELESVKKIFFDCWKASKNASIRAIIFQFTFELLCREKDPANAVSLWELIELFIDNLSFEEDKKIYDLMSSVSKVPLNVRAKYLMKSYKFMKSLAQKVKEEDRNRYQSLTAQLAQHTREIMEEMSPDFVTDVIKEFIDKDFFGTENYFGTIYSSGGIISVISAYLLCSKDENVQTEKYEKVFVPIMQRAFSKWGDKRDGNYVTRVHFQYLLTRLSDDLKDYVAENKMIVPVKMFVDIQTELDKNLSISENYMLLSKWKLTVAVAKLAGKLNSDTKDWEGIATEIAPEFGKICLDYLKEDVKLHFPCIYKLFAKVLNEMFSTLFTGDYNKVKIYESLLADTDFVQGYLITILNSSDSYSYNKENYGGLWKKIFEHPSVEVKMHYYYRNRDERRY
ncbi:hypothetical protein PYW08_008265 [Mythimna loreyi]|uniref:Uncharacterized protein n=1 Tax=Mythimna loreyi TaxID=667449 RepID=A0ACC2QBG9_9NEOP|nr:hypothetical protein PYW08_008265 [Mythimna loreyi]